MITIDRIAALCPPEMRWDLILLSPYQRRRLNREIRQAIYYARQRAKDGRKDTPGPTPHSTHKRAEYNRRWHRENWRREHPPRVRKGGERMRARMIP